MKQVTMTLSVDVFLEDGTYENQLAEKFNGKEDEYHEAIVEDVANVITNEIVAEVEYGKVEYTADVPNDPEDKENHDED